MRPHTTKARNVDCQLDHPGSLAGLSHPTDPDIGHEIGMMGVSPPRYERDEQKTSI